MSGFELNLPEVLAEVTAACDRYEVALTTNLVHELDAMFWNSTTTIRYGVTENLYGYSEIQAFRAVRPSKGLMRTVLRREITTFGQTMAISHLEFSREGSERIGRQSQTWMRMPVGWRVVCAHVSGMG